MDGSEFSASGSCEVREGFECGIRIAGFDDVKVGDQIETYRIEQIARTLD